jgi:hypothetical protein
MRPLAPVTGGEVSKAHCHNVQQVKMEIISWNCITYEMEYQLRLEHTQ